MYEISEEKTERDETQKFSKHDKKKKSNQKFSNHQETQVI